MSNKYTQDMTGLGTHVELPDDPGPEPERYYDWMLWKLRQDPKWKETMSTNKTSLSDGVENTLFAFKPRLKMVAKKILGGSSLTLAAIYTLGHVLDPNVLSWNRVRKLVLRGGPLCVRCNQSELHINTS